MAALVGSNCATLVGETPSSLSQVPSIKMTILFMTAATTFSEPVKPRWEGRSLEICFQSGSASFQTNSALHRCRGPETLLHNHHVDIREIRHIQRSKIIIGDAGAWLTVKTIWITVITARRVR